MADFNKFLPILLKQEGYYSNAAGDTGGETWEGISRNNCPAWSGWLIVDSYRHLPDFPRNLRADTDLQAKVNAFYKTSQWDAIQGDLILNQSLANFIADWGINAGMSTPVKHLQEILSIAVDGKVGPHTLAAINGADWPDLFAKLQGARKQFYLDVVRAHPGNKQFLSNWLERTASFIYEA